MGWGDERIVPGHAGGGTLLRDWRERTGTSLKELQRRTGLTYRTITKAAAGMPVSGVTALKLSRATGIDVVAFLRQGRE